MVEKIFWDRLKEKIGGFQLLIIFILIASIFYFSATTRWIPPANRINLTDDNNNTVEVIGIYSYSAGEYVLKEKEFEYENLEIPKDSFELEKAIFLIFFLIVLTVLNFRKEKRPDIITWDEAEKEARRYLDSQLDLKKIQSYEIPMTAFLKKKQVDSGEKLPDQWLIPANSITTEGMPEHHVLGINPWTANLERDFKTKKEFSGDDTCSRCGAFYSEHIISPVGYKDWFEKFYPKRGGGTSF